MFSLLCGRLPFNQYNLQDAKRLLCGEVAFEPLTDDPNDNFNLFQGVSEEAKDLIRSLLDADPERRFSIKDALGHPWFQMFFETEQQLEKQNNDIFEPFDDETEH